MGIALVGLICLIGIILENVKWPLDRSAQKQKLLEAESAAESIWLIVGLVLGHSVVRWILALGFASIMVLFVLRAPPILSSVKAAKDQHGVPVYLVEIAIGMVISVLMSALAITARRFAR